MSNRTALIGVFFLSLTLLLAGAVVRGPYMTNGTDFYFNDSNSYLNTGTRIISWLSSGEPTLNELNGSTRFPYYAISCVLLSTIHGVLDMGAMGVVVFNSVLFSIIVCLAMWFWTTVYETWSQWWGRRGFFLGVAGGLYVLFGLPDGFLWSYAVLTDIIFLFWVSVFVVAITQSIFNGWRLLWVVALIAALTAPFVRPTGILLILLLVYALGLVWSYRKGISVNTAALVSLGVASAGAFVIFPWIVLIVAKKMSYGDGSVVTGSLEQYFFWIVNFFRGGIVVKTRVELGMDSPLSYFEIIKIMVHRLLYYWIPVRFGYRPYSTMHNIVNLVYIVAALPLFFIGAGRLFRRGGHFALVTLFLLMVSYAFALMHAMTLVSFDWRYQVPAMVPFWMLVGCGLYSLLDYRMRDEIPYRRAKVDP